MSGKVEYFGMIRAVKALDKKMQKEAKKLGYKPNDIVFVIMDAVGNYAIEEKIEGSIVEWQRKKGLLIKK
jgi:hypothetical protein